MTLVWLFIFLLILFGITQIYSAWQLSKLRDSGIYPQKGKAVLADVIRLRDAGLTVWAIRCYREINKVSLKEAKIAVSELAE